MIECCGKNQVNLVWEMWVLQGLQETGRESGQAGMEDREVQAAFGSLKCTASGAIHTLSPSHNNLD